MNLVLWVLQVLLAFHTAVGAVWKFGNSEQAVPSLNVLPHGFWLALSALELICCVFLILPAFKKRFGFLIPLGAGFIVAEMLLYCGVHLYSGDTNYAPMIYWLVVAAFSTFIVIGRTKLRPVR